MSRWKSWSCRCLVPVETITLPPHSMAGTRYGDRSCRCPCRPRRSACSRRRRAPLLRPLQTVVRCAASRAGGLQTAAPDVSAPRTSRARASRGPTLPWRQRRRATFRFATPVSDSRQSAAPANRCRRRCRSVLRRGEDRAMRSAPARRDAARVCRSQRRCRRHSRVMKFQAKVSSGEFKASVSCKVRLARRAPGACQGRELRRVRPVRAAIAAR